jgi:ubiquinone/menaquinone biosynthesis C-methylase UbiE
MVQTYYKIKQDTSFWESEEAIRRYAKMEYKLNDIEFNYIMEAKRLLAKNASEIKILDLGCGGGRTTVPLFKMGFKVTGVDISKNLIKQLNKKFPEIDACVGDAANLKFQKNSFDIVLFSHSGIDCLYPKEKRIKCLKEIYRVLKPQGFFIFSSHTIALPLKPSTFKQFIFNIHRFISGSDYYTEIMQNHKVEIYFGTLSKIRREIEKNGFELVKSSKKIVKFSNVFLDFIINTLNWERYYLVRKLMR